MKILSNTVASKLRREARTVCAHTLVIAGEEASYRLLERTPQYFAECTYGCERLTVPLGQSFSRAAMLFEMLWRGEVTPCTVIDVLEDRIKELEMPANSLL